MFYIVFALICFIFFYALFLENKNKKEIIYDKESNFKDDDFLDKKEGVIFKADKSKYHFKSSFIGISIENNSDTDIYITRNYDIEIKKDDIWYSLDIDKRFENFEKDLKIKRKESFYQNIFIDKYKLTGTEELRIIKKIKINDIEYLYKTEVKLHNSKIDKLIGIN